MTAARERRAPLVPPRWIVRAEWAAHHALVRWSGGRWGYLEDGPNLVLMATNGWSPASPAWEINLQANPLARIQLVGESRTVQARVAREDERPRLWAEMVRVTPGDLDAYAATRSRETPLVILETVNKPENKEGR